MKVVACEHGMTENIIYGM